MMLKCKMKVGDIIFDGIKGLGFGFTFSLFLVQKKTKI